MLTHYQENNIELVPPEHRKHSLVLKADFPNLEYKKEIATAALIREQDRQYKKLYEN